MRRRLPGRTLDLARPGRCEQRPGSPLPCQRIAEDVPAGTISLRVKAHTDELSGLIRNTEEKEKGEHPLERLMAISDEPDGLRVTTTGLHLAQRIGHALEAAYDGELRILYDGEAYYVDVHWLRD